MKEPVKSFSHSSNARRAARAALGKSAVEGVDYKLKRVGVAGVTFEPIQKAKPAKPPRAKKEPAKVKAKAPAKKGRKVIGRARTAPLDDFVEVPDAKVRATNTWLDQLCAMLSRPKGATALEVAEAFGWLEHTSRARISVGPRERNQRAERTREERGGKMVSVYRLVTELPLGQKRDELGVRYVKPDRKVKAAA